MSLNWLINEPALLVSPRPIGERVAEGRVRGNHLAKIVNVNLRHNTSPKFFLVEEVNLLNI